MLRCTARDALAADGFLLPSAEITALFTTPAPSGAVAYLLMSLPVLSGRATGDTARRLNQLTCLPLLVAMVGLVASATHLGNPANALYVFTGVGRSPLSTEVFAAVIFLALAGVYWLYSFAEHPRVGLQRILLVAIDVAIVAFVIAVAFAYNVDVIITWSLLSGTEPCARTPCSEARSWLSSAFGVAWAMTPVVAACASCSPSRRGLQQPTSPKKSSAGSFRASKTSSSPPLISWPAIPSILRPSLCLPPAPSPSPGVP